MQISKLCICHGHDRSVVKLFNRLMCENCGNEIVGKEYKIQVLQTEEVEDLDREKKENDKDKRKLKHDKKDKADIHLTD